MSAQVELLYQERRARVAIVPVVTNLQLFQEKPELLTKAYRIQSSVNPDVFQPFAEAISGHEIEIKDDNVEDLVRLSNELGFASLAMRCSKFQGQNRIGEQQQKIRDLKRRCKEQKSHLLAAQQQAAGFQKQVLELEARGESDRAELIRLEDQVSEQDKKLQAQKELIRSHKEEVRNYQSQLEGLKEQNNELEEVVSGLQRKNGDLRQQNVDLQERTRTLDREIERHKTDIRELQEAQSRDLASVTQELARMRERMEALKEVEAMRTKELARLHDENADLAKSNQRLQNMIVSTEHDQAQQQERFVSRQGEAAELRSELLAVKAELATVRTQRETQRKELDDLRKRVSEGQNQSQGKSHSSRGSRATAPEVSSSVSSSQEHREAAQEGKQFPLSDDAPLRGIIAYLTKEYGGNVHDQGIVKISSSGAYTEQPETSPKVIADLKSKSCFVSAFRKKDEAIADTPNKWLCYDFKNRRVIVTNYTIRSMYNGYVNGPNLKSWLIQVSLDGEEWTEIDRRDSNADLNGKDITRTFAVLRHEVGRFVRLVNIGRNHFNSDMLCISSFELFGSLIERE
jgi:septal ring factor EnvC (AmiA/AmiB activator)